MYEDHNEFLHGSRRSSERILSSFFIRKYIQCAKALRPTLTKVLKSNIFSNLTFIFRKQQILFPKSTLDSAQLLMFQVILIIFQMVNKFIKRETRKQFQSPLERSRLWSVCQLLTLNAEWPKESTRKMPKLPLSLFSSPTSPRFVYNLQKLL